MPVTIWLVNQMGADVSALDINGISPLMEAVQHRHHGIIKFLQAKKVTLASEGREGRQACRGRRLDVAMLIVSPGGIAADPVR